MRPAPHAAPLRRAAPAPRAPAGRAPAARRGEQGLSIVLSMLVLFVLLVVVFQVFHFSQVELDQVAYLRDAKRFRLMAEAGDLMARSSLLMDIQDADSGGGQGAAPGEDPEGGGLTDQVAGGGPADIAGSTDSLLDEWQTASSLAPPMGEDLTVYVEVTDEDAKINLLGLWNQDDDARKDWREVFTRLLDRAFEGTDQDLTNIDAEDLLDDLDNWVTGQRGTFRRFPVPPVKNSTAQDEAEGSLDTDIIETEEREFPLTLGELLFLEGLEPAHLEGFVEDDAFFPGLREYLTLWTHLELKEALETEEDPFEGSVFDDVEEQDGGNPESDDEVAPKGTNDGLVNVNTASLVVMRALAPEDIPTSFLERIIEFREQIHEVRDEYESLYGSIYPDDDEEDESSIFDDEDANDGPEDEQDDPAYYVFQSPSEIWTKVEDEFELSVFTDEAEKTEFSSRFGTSSQVFTVKILVIDPEGGAKASYRTTIWRMETQDDPRIIVLSPLEEYFDPRRIEDYPEELQELVGDTGW